MPETIPHNILGIKQSTSNITGSDYLNLSRHSEEKYDRLCRRYPETLSEFPRHYVRWEEVEDSIFADLFSNGLTTNEICKKLERGPGAIQSRLKKLGLLE